jgi:hypothetical protein
VNNFGQILWIFKVFIHVKQVGGGIFAVVQHVAQHGKVANGINACPLNTPSSSFQFFSQNGTKQQKLMTIIVSQKTTRNDRR